MLDVKKRPGPPDPIPIEDLRLFCIPLPSQRSQQQSKSFKMLKMFGFSGGSAPASQQKEIVLVTPPSSENGDSLGDIWTSGCPIDTAVAVNIDAQGPNAAVAAAAANAIVPNESTAVNTSSSKYTPTAAASQSAPATDTTNTTNSASISSPTLYSRPFTPPSPPTSLKSRRVSREANRSKQFTTRQRSTTETSSSSADVSIRKKPRRFNNQPANNLGAQEGLKAVEKLHDPSLVKMAYAEQQQWVTVQQKTFMKWLNSKIEPRELSVKDLIKDLRDGVCISQGGVVSCGTDNSAGYPHSFIRMSIK